MPRRRTGLLGVKERENNLKEPETQPKPENKE